MSSILRFTLKDTPEYQVDMSPLLPELLEGKTLAQIKTTKLPCGNKKIAVNDLFQVRGKAGDSLEIHNSHRKLKNIGKGMSRGRIEIFGMAGDNVGMSMSSGELQCNGRVGNWLGASMSGGTITVKGNAGDFIGAGKAGQMQGMNGGMIIVAGNAGDRLGDRMRRGTIFVTKNTGDYCGSRMIAGTIVVLGAPGLHCGYAMKRGTIILTDYPDNLSPTFQSCGELDLGYLKLLIKQFAQMGQPLSKLNRYSSKAIRYAGDMANKGLGEIIHIQ